MGISAQSFCRRKCKFAGWVSPGIAGILYGTPKSQGTGNLHGFSASISADRHRFRFPAREVIILKGNFEI